MKVGSIVMRVAPWAIPVLTAGIFVLDLLTPVGVAVSVLYIIPLLLTFLSSRARDPLYFCALATGLIWIDFFLKPAGLPIPYGAFNRTMGTFVMWGVALGLLHYKRTQQGLVAAEADKTTTARELMSERVERAHAEGLMMAAQEARAYADTAILGATAGRREAEEQLLASQLRLEGIIQSAMDAIITVDQDQRIVLFNRSAEGMFGYKTEEALGQSLDRFIPARFRAAHHHHVAEFGKSGATSRRMGTLGQVIGLRASGEEFPVEAAISQVGVEGQRYFTVILRDITERKRAEQALLESEERLRLFIEHAPAAIAMFDREMRYLAMSRRWAEDYRLTGDILGRSHYDAFPEISARWKEVHRRGLAGEILSADEDPFLCGDGSVQWIKWEVRPWYSGGHVGGILIATEEVTARVQSKNALRESEERLNQAVQVAKFGIFEHDHRSDTLYWSPLMREIYGLPVQEPASLQGYIQLIHPDDRETIMAAVRRAHDPTGDGLFSAEHRLLRRDGSVRWVSLQSRTLFDGEGSARRPVRTLGAMIDITERKHLEEQLRRTERIAELGTLASGMAHEIGTPMNVILGRAEYLMERVRDAPLKKGLQTIVSQVERITKVMNQLLAFARRGPTERRAVDLRQAVEDNLEIFHERLAKQSIKVETAFAISCPPVHADADQMSQVLINLVMNAIHAMPHGGTLRVCLSPGQGTVALTVADTGHGIPQDVTAKIFDPFFTTKETGKGTGLGLTVVKGIVEEHGGTIAVESEPGRGTTFTILLPRSL